MTAVHPRRQPSRSLHLSLGAVPPALRPAVSAFLFGYASAVGPRILTLLAQYCAAIRASGHDGEKKRGRAVSSLRSALASGFGWNRFPAFCAALAGGSTLLEVPVRRLLEKLLGASLASLNLTRLARWLSTFFAAALSLRLLQSRETPAYTETVPVKSDHPPGVEAKTVRYAGRTLDLTLFAVARALDVLVRDLWSRRRPPPHAWTKTDAFLCSIADPAVFSVSCAVIMWSWFYYPSRLPKTYRKWISSAAAVDERLIDALRLCKQGTLRYGEDTGVADLLGSMCRDFNLPPVWGDPAQTTPFPCELVHMGCGPSCEYHAFSRFLRSFAWSATTYLPINLALQLRNPSAKALKRALLSALRSSAFLGTFISLFYYGVCLTRTRLGPKILGKDIPARNAIDGGGCVATGCFLCGWSILLEAPRRRPELALFVAPRALASFFPRKYPVEDQWKETLAFALSAATLFAAAAEDKTKVRGVLGKLLAKVMQR
ncbi:hypothetical protein jhhlp_004318 [Lomentospora prolificans]|uniref:Integral membrane protein n=1 Tax=Lomentospora prolificans TaxID=41688 RepID=A0A2N3NBC1_9PEZI|nr:hypothetical protein jhhlp_004318 [Lomentospora prolificans]